MALDNGTGYNETQVKTSIAGVNTAYRRLMMALINEGQNKFINPMADAWACNEAIKYFAEVKNAFDAQADSITGIFQSVVDSMNSAAAGWAGATDTAYSPVAFEANPSKVDVTCIKENINGVRGINGADANTAMGQLAVIKAAVEDACDAAKTAVENCGFIGATQAESLVGSLLTIKTNITTSFGELTDSAKTGIDATIQRYGELATKVSTAFTA